VLKPLASVFSLCIALALCATLASCGGGGSSAAAPSVIRFIATNENPCSSCAPPKPGRLVISPLAGASALGNHDIAKVELTVNVDQAPAQAPQVLTAPNGTNAAGQASYVFQYAAAYTPPPGTVLPPPTHVCVPHWGFTITITDVTGFSFTKSASACQVPTFEGFSDYGDKTVAFKASSSVPAWINFRRASADSLYGDESRAWGVLTNAWVVKARDKDALFAGGTFDANAADGETLSVSVEGEGGAFASSTIAKKSSTSALATLICCGSGTAAPSSAQDRTIAFAVATSRYNEPQTGQPRPFNVYYRISNPSTGAVVTEFRGALPGNVNANGAYYTEWQFTVKPGYELKLEASPQDVDTYVQLYIGGDASNPSAYYNTLGEAMSNRPGVPAKLNVFCCMR
jgi:hypothetical protein